MFFRNLIYVVSGLIVAVYHPSIVVCRSNQVVGLEEYVDAFHGTLQLKRKTDYQTFTVLVDVL